MSKKLINSRIDQLFSNLTNSEDQPSDLSAINDVKSFAWQIDKNGVYTDCGPEVFDILGFHPEEVIGNPIISFQLPPDQQSSLRQTLENDVFPCDLELMFVNKSFSLVPTRCNIFQVRDEKNEISGYRGLIQELTTIKDDLNTNEKESLELIEESSETDLKITQMPVTSEPSEQYKQNLKQEITYDVDEIPQNSVDPIDFGVQTSPLPSIENNTKITQKKVRSIKAREVKPKVFSEIRQNLEDYRLTNTAPLTPRQLVATEPDTVNRTSIVESIKGITLRGNKFYDAENLWTHQGRLSYKDTLLVSQPSTDENPAVLAAPLMLRDKKTGVIEIIDDSKNRKWTEEERLLVQEVTKQLGLALENAQLYSAIQKELTERVKAETETLQRNKDLATLNLVGQQLSRLVSHEEIFRIVSQTIQETLNVNNLLISELDATGLILNFPVCIVDGENQFLKSRAITKGYQEIIIESRVPLQFGSDVKNEIPDKVFDHPNNIPLSLLAVPLITGDRAIGVISVFNYLSENAFDQTQAELLFTIATQAATSLENAKLFGEIRNALQTIEIRERYQSNVTNAVASLSEKGTTELLILLESLSKAAACDRVYFSELLNDQKLGPNWVMKGSYTIPTITQIGGKEISTFGYISAIPGWAEDLSKNGWYTCKTEDSINPEKEYLESNNIKSILLLAVNRSTETPGIICLENFNESHEWKTEEINILQIAADAFKNTLIREQLLEQVQISLDETENLYSASHKLALASDMTEMISAVITGVSVTSINRGVLVLFEYDQNNLIERMVVEANYYSGFGTPPPTPGTEYLKSLYEKIFIERNPFFYDDLTETQIDSPVQDILIRQNIRSMAILPLWTGNTQIGVLLFQSGQKHIFSDQEIRSFPPLADQMATAIQNLRLFKQTQEALSETELLYNISSGIAKSTDLPELVQLVGNNVMPENVENLWLYRTSRNEQANTLIYESVGSINSQKQFTKSERKLNSDVFSFIDYSKPEPYVYSNIGKSDLPLKTKEALGEFGFLSCGIIPLQTAGNPVGCMICGSRRISEFDSGEMHTLQIVGNSIAVAMERQKLLTEAQRRALELQTAAEIARDTTSTLSYEILLNRIVNLLKDRFGFYHCSIYLLDETKMFAVIEESTGEAGLELKHRKHKVAVGSKSVLGSCTASGKTVLVNDTSHSPIFFPNPLLPETNSELGLPLKISGQVIGVLDLQSKYVNAFSENELTVLQILSDQISVAIENARAYALSQLAVEEMREIDRVKSQFLANMSHELRTPLNSVIGFSRVILKGIDGPINDIQEQDITAIYNSGMHLLNMINEILDLSKIEAGKMELQVEDINLSDLINSAITNSTGLIKGKAIELIQKVPADLPLVKADEMRISQVVINLISNAVKFTEKGSITIEAAVSTSPTNKPEILITITDTGIGIALEDQQKLFQRFSQVDDSPTRKTGGTGLGLSICLSLIELHGGRIGLLNSQVGKGSTFYFTLPLADKVPGVDINQLTHGENVILAIDDDSQVISLYERFLRPQGFEVIPLTDATLAVERAKELKPFAITLDIMMPQKDGWQVLQDLKKDAATKNIPILICSILEEEEKGFNLGASEYLVKPFLQDDLINAIQRLDRDGNVHEVLVIDNDPDDLRLIQIMISEKSNYHSTVVQNGQEALEKLKTLTPDIILLDLFMPVLNGFELLELFKTDARLNRIPVIVLTSADLTTEQQKQLSSFRTQMIPKGLLKEKDLLKYLETALADIKKIQSQG